VLRVDRICVKEKRSADEALVNEVGSEGCNPVESAEANAGFEHKEGNRLLDEQADDDGPPLDSGPVPRGRPETKLEHDETQDGNGAIHILRSLRGRLASRVCASVTQCTVTYFFELETKCGPEGDRNDGEPAQGEAHIFRDAEEGLLYEGNPHCLEWAGNRVGDKAEDDDKDKRPGEDGLHDPSVAGRLEGDGGDPPSEDKEGKADEAHDAKEAMAAGRLALESTVDDEFLGVDLALLLVLDRSRMG
jgi:hypothetical protein